MILPEGAGAGLVEGLCCGTLGLGVVGLVLGVVGLVLGVEGRVLGVVGLVLGVAGFEGGTSLLPVGFQELVLLSR